MKEKRCGTCDLCNRKKKICKVTNKRVMLINDPCKVYMPKEQ